MIQAPPAVGKTITPGPGPIWVVSRQIPTVLLQRIEELGVVLSEISTIESDYPLQPTPWWLLFFDLRLDGNRLRGSHSESVDL